MAKVARSVYGNSATGHSVQKTEEYEENLGCGDRFNLIVVVGVIYASILFGSR